MTATTKARWITAGIGLAIVGAVTLPPLLSPGVRSVVMAAFSGVCHQLPDRSPHLNGVALAVCHRCYGIYWGIPVAAALYGVLQPLFGGRYRIAPYILVASLVPAGLDWGLDVFGLVHNVAATRVGTGWIFGLTAGFFLTSAIVDVMQKRRSTTKSAPPPV